MKLTKNVDCFLDGYGSYSKKLVTFAIKALKAYLFCYPEALKKSSGSANEMVNRAIISPEYQKATTNKQTAPIIMQSQHANSPDFSLD